jgi:hypothetical protein
VTFGKCTHPKRIRGRKDCVTEAGELALAITVDELIVSGAVKEVGEYAKDGAFRRAEPIVVGVETVEAVFTSAKRW